MTGELTRETEEVIKKMIEDRVQPLERRIRELERLLSVRPKPTPIGDPPYLGR